MKPNKRWTSYFSPKTGEEKSPVRNTLEIIFIYAAIGIVWIFGSDWILSIIIGDMHVEAWVQTLKGIAYVLTTAYLFYLIIKRRMDLYFRSIHDLHEAVEKLQESNMNLMELEKKLTQLAYFDTLTGLPSKNRLIEEVTNHVLSQPDEPLGVVLIDIDDFKKINELKGHKLGDDLIVAIGKELTKFAPSPHVVGRFIGDDFLLLMKSLPGRQEILEAVKQTASFLPPSFLLGEERIFVSVSAGIAVFPEDGVTFDSLVQHANMALNAAKLQGKNRALMFEPAIESRTVRQIELGNLLHFAIPNGEISVQYQPIIDIRDNYVHSVEALLRWNHPVKGAISPMDFIPLAESTGVIHELTWFVIGECFRLRQEWRDAGVDTGIAINISSLVLMESGFLDRIRAMATDFAVSPADFTLEITESVVLDRMEDAVRRIGHLRAFGFHVSLDDFGTGYSSLTYLQNLPIDFLKLDRGFISHLDLEHHEAPLVRFIVEYAHDLGIKIVSEGVEKPYQLEKLQEYGSDLIQGFFYAKPMDRESAYRYIRGFHK